jgi:hypothetical protein
MNSSLLCKSTLEKKIPLAIGFLSQGGGAVDGILARSRRISAEKWQGGGPGAPTRALGRSRGDNTSGERKRRRGSAAAAASGCSARFDGMQGNT